MTRLDAIGAALRRRPWQVFVGCLAAGLAAGPRVPLLLVALCLVVPLVTPSTAAAAAAILALAAGFVVAELRLAALGHNALGPRIGHAVRADLTLQETPRASAFGWRVFAKLGDDRVLVRGRGPTPSMSAGDVAAVFGSLRAPGHHDAWLVGRHVAGVILARTLNWTGRRRGGPAGRLDAVRRRADHVLAAGLPGPEGALLRGMVLGDDAALTPATRDELRRSGLGHLVAASGANIALLAALLMALGALLGLRLGGRMVMILLAIAVYVPLAGSGASIQRAGIMGAVSVVAALASRPADRWHALLLAAVLTLSLDPAAIDDPGWRLSFAAVLAIVVLTAPLAGRLLAAGLSAGVAEAVALTTAATLGTAPVAAATFGTLSVVAIPANILVIPVVAPITWLGMCAALVGQVSDVLAWPLKMAALPALGFVTWVGHAAAGIPGAQIAAGPVPVTAGCGTIAAIVLSRRVRARSPALVGVFAAACLAFLLLRPDRHVAAPRAGVVRVSFLDIGQGDATLLQDGQHAILVDSGPPDGPVLERLRQAGVRRLDVLVATHAQADHDGAAGQVVAAMPVGVVLDGRDGVREPYGHAMAASAASRGVRLVAPVAGDVVHAGGIELQVLWPADRGGATGGADPNDRAIVMLARGPGLRLLLTADAESDVLSRLDLGRIDVLKVSHHGSADPGLPALLRRLSPRLAVIEVGKRNTYGHPTSQTLAALSAAGARVMRTDRDGTVRVESSGGALHVQAHA